MYVVHSYCLLRWQWFGRHAIDFLGPLKWCFLTGRQLMSLLACKLSGSEPLFTSRSHPIDFLGPLTQGALRRTASWQSATKVLLLTVLCVPESGLDSLICAKTWP